MTRISIPICDPAGFFLARPGVPVDILSVSKASLPAVFSGHAIFSLLQFGAVVPPLSPWEGVKRLLPGYTYDDDLHAHPLSFCTSTDPTSATEDPTAAFTAWFDKILLRALDGDNKRPVVLFSGGVDSGLIAARLAKLGYKDTLLLNFSFGSDDKESLLAEAMAKTLGLRFERITREALSCACLEAPGKIYPLPFGDHSTVPTSALANAVVDRLGNGSHVIFDGTGADGAFGMTEKVRQWLRLSRIPRPVLSSASSIYQRSGLWHRVGVSEYRLRILSRMNDMPILSAILAQNPLAGVLYANDGRDVVDSLLDKWISGWAGDALLQKTIAADLAMTCANTFAQKAYPIFKKANFKVAYPFMADEMVGFALSIAPFVHEKEKKTLLKALLCQQVPREMVYRPKSGFVDTSDQVFYQSQFIDYLWGATEEKSVLSNIVFKKPLKKVCDLLHAGRRLPDQLLNCIWSIAFTDRWYRTV